MNSLIYKDGTICEFFTFEIHENFYQKGVSVDLWISAPSDRMWDYKFNKRDPITLVVDVEGSFL